MKKQRHNFFDNVRSISIFWVASIVLGLFAFNLSFSPDWIGTAFILALIAAVAFLVSTILFIIAFFYALYKGLGRRVAIQAVIFIATLAIAYSAYKEIEVPPSGKRAWHSSPPNAPFPFAVEYRLTDPLLGCRSKRIVFPSGRRTGLASGEASNSPVFIYALDSGRFAVACRDSFIPFFYIYRIDPVAETVDYFSNGIWYTLPPDTVDFTASGNDAPLVRTQKGSSSVRHGVSVGDELAHRRYLGSVDSSGTFEAGGSQDPLSSDFDSACSSLPPHSPSPSLPLTLEP
ncbi:MAG: hypothetical protein IJT88_09885 [Kiritimatiellae bacterium]|nr:hypothetical protein [Kiritimatiellia bacterium]